MTEKKNEIIFLNVLFCILVIFIHVSSQAITSLNRFSLQFISVFIPWRLSSFVVQGFILLSGVKYFLNCKSKKFSLKRFYVSRLKLIVIPYILWVIIYYAVYCAYGYYSFSLTELFKYILIGNVASHFYFVVIIVQFYALMPLWIGIVKRIRPATAITASIILMISSQLLPLIYNSEYYDRVFVTYIAYWVIGCYIGANYERFIVLIKRNTLPIILIFITLSTADLFANYMSMAYNKHAFYFETLHVFYCLAAIIFMYMAGFRIAEKFTCNRLVLAINKTSYLIYLSHCLVLFFVARELELRNVKDMFYLYIFRFVFVYSVSLLSCIAYDKFKSMIFSIKLPVQKNREL